VSKNVLIVESENDKYFIESFIKYLNISNVDVDTPICSIIDDYECLNGLSKAELERKLTELSIDIGKIDIGKKGIEKIGVILDADQEGIEKRIELINESLKVIDENLNLQKCNHFIKSEKLDVEIACYIMNINGFGELETVLKTIKSQDSVYADCLYDWKKCLEQKGKVIKNKDFDKFWVNNYQRFDCCTKKEQKQADKKCNNEESVKKPLWNFNHTALSELKIFLKLFN